MCEEHLQPENFEIIEIEPDVSNAEHHVPRLRHRFSHREGLPRASKMGDLTICVSQFILLAALIILIQALRKTLNSRTTVILSTTFTNPNS